MIRLPKRVPLRASAQPFIAPLLYVATLLLALTVSSVTGPAFDEIARIAAVERMGVVITRVAAEGVGALLHPQARSGFGEVEGGNVLAPLIAAWSKLSLGRIGLLDRLTSVRLPWLALGALVPACTFLIVGPSRGPLVALVAALLLLGMPRFVHGAAIGSEAIAIAGLWLAVLACYLRSLGPARPLARGPSPRRLCWAIFGAALLAFSVAVSFAALFLLPILLAHFFFARFAAARRLLRRGRLAVPALAGFAAIFVPLAVFVLNPPLWGISAPQAARWLLAPLSPDVVPVLHRARTVSAVSPPTLGYALDWLVFTLPSVVLVAALVGLVAIAHRALGRRFASGRLRPPRDRHALGALAVIGLGAVLLGPALAPAPLLRFPPRVELALPFVAMAAALGLEALGSLVLEGRRWLFYAAPVVVCALVLSSIAPATQGASYAPLLGGARTVQGSRIFAGGDGSELASFAPAIDGLGRATLELQTNEAPPELWRVLVEMQRLRTTIVAAAADRGAAELVRGPLPGRAGLARVRRDGAVLWTLALTGR
jgi:hypothetical protein